MCVCVGWDRGVGSLRGTTREPLGFRLLVASLVEVLFSFFLAEGLWGHGFRMFRASVLVSLFVFFGGKPEP